MTIWCLDSAPLLLGNDLTQMDAFTLSLLENDEVLAIDQDAMGKQGTTVEKGDGFLVYEKHLADGSIAVGLFNLADDGPATITANWADLGISGKRSVRDLWRQKDLGQFTGSFAIRVAPHSAELVKIQ